MIVESGGVVRVLVLLPILFLFWTLPRDGSGARAAGSRTAKAKLRLLNVIPKPARRERLGSRDSDFGSPRAGGALRSGESREEASEMARVGLWLETGHVRAGIGLERPLALAQSREHPLINRV